MPTSLATSCRVKVEAQLKLTKKDAEQVTKDITMIVRGLASADNVAWAAMTIAQRIQAAADNYVIFRKERAEKVLQRTLQKAEIFKAFNDRLNAGDDPRQVITDMVFSRDGAKMEAFESKEKAITHYLLSLSFSVFDSLMKKFGPVQWNSKAAARDFIYAIHGEKSSPAMKAIAETWSKTAEFARQRFNAVGGAVNRLEDWLIPQSHSLIKVSKATKDGWVKFIMPLLRRDRYVHDDGRLMDDGELITFLEHAYDTISSNGANKHWKSGGSKTGRRELGSRYSEHRELHFKDAESQIKYNEEYGEHNLYDTMLNHLAAVSQDIALAETFGHNAYDNINALLAMAHEAAIKQHNIDPEKLETQFNQLRRKVHFATGNVDDPVNPRLARGFDTLRRWMVASRLGSAVIAALGDTVFMHLTGHVLNLPHVQITANAIRSLPNTDAAKNLAIRMGLAADTVTGSLNRLMENGLDAHSFASNIASSVMRMSGMTWLDASRRRGFAMTLYSALGEIVGKYDRLDQIAPGDHRILLGKGITPQHWAIWKMANLDDIGVGNGLLTPAGIMDIPNNKLMAKFNMTEADAENAKFLAARRLLSATLDETDIAVLRPGKLQHYYMSGQFARGTFFGELGRSIFLFKSFPFSLVAKHWMRVAHMPGTTSKAAYIASIIAGTTIMGAMTLSINNILLGKDPPSFNPAHPDGWKNVFAAMLKGGSLGLYGDFLSSQTQQYTNVGVLSTMAGPLVSGIEEFIGLTHGNLIEFFQGTDTNSGAELVRFLQHNTPGASLWFAKGALNHLIFQQLQEHFSPGYLKRMERRARKFGTTFFWKPGASFSDIDRWPDLAKVWRAQ